MFVRIEKADLLAGISTAMRAVGTGQSQPILSCFLMDAGEDGVQLTSNNLEMSIQTSTIPCNPSMDQVAGQVALEARVFADIIKSLPSGEVEISVDDKYHTTIKSGKSKFSIPGLDPKDFPINSDIEPVGSFTIDSALFRNMVRQTIFCVAQDFTKLVLTGELFKVSAGQIELCAVDGFRIAFSQGKTDYDGEDFSIVIPGKTLSEIAKLLPTGKDAKITMSFDDKKIWFGFEGAKVMSRLLDGAFVDYGRMLAVNNENCIIVNRVDLLGALERATLIGERKTPVNLDIADGSMKISSRTELGKMDEEISVECMGDKLAICFNPGFLMDTLKAITADKVEMSFSGQVKPCIIRAEGDEDCKYLVLPLRPPAEMVSSSSESEAIAAKAA